MTALVPETSMPKIMIELAEKSLAAAARRSSPARRARLLQAAEEIAKVRVGLRRLK